MSRFVKHCPRLRVEISTRDIVVGRRQNAEAVKSNYKNEQSDSGCVTCKVWRENMLQDASTMRSVMESYGSVVGK